MDTKDFRIGNLLFDREGKLCRVEELNGMENKIYAPAIVGGLTALPNIPIPITEEWLIRLGFYEEYKSQFTIKYTHSKSQFGYEWSKATGWHFRYYGQYIDCKYLHQLQNLFFTLTGDELKLNRNP